ncbi:MAG: hypothetical protein ACRDTF_13400 [Pseudonocardiaceae bacterium]
MIVAVYVVFPGAGAGSEPHADSVEGVPVVAVDPVDGGGKVSAQARAWSWPALVTAEEPPSGSAELRQWWRWCLSAHGRVTAAQCAASTRGQKEELVSTSCTLSQHRPGYPHHQPDEQPRRSLTVRSVR